MNVGYTAPFLLSFQEGVSLVEQADGETLLSASFVQLSLKGLSKGLRAALGRLSSGGATVEELVGLMARSDGGLGPPTLLYYLEHFVKLGLICHTVVCDAVKLATIVPISPSYQFKSKRFLPEQRYVLSRFAYLHQDKKPQAAGGEWVLECPLGHAKLLLHDWRTHALLHALSKPHNLAELCQEFQPLSADAIAGCLSLLLACQSLCEAKDNASRSSVRSTRTRQEEALAQWEFHDLLFHSRSRLGRHRNPYRGSYRFVGQIPAQPVVKAPMSQDAITLYRPDLEALKKEDQPLTRVLEERRSIRQHGASPITLKQLGEFLYRTARVKQIVQIETPKHQLSRRAYPSGGACYELEVYIASHHCEGLAAGFYHYCPKTHQLYKLATPTPDLDALLEGARHATREDKKPQVLIVLAACFQRIAWKYESIAYATILKDVGVLYQTMYLVATAMGLAASAVGGGNADLFAAAAGTNYYAESSVGEFVLGSRVTK
ncbi:MAG: SagB family peptide dehydrogenase [Ardenticatenaceae bacterium]